MQQIRTDGLKFIYQFGHLIHVVALDLNRFMIWLCCWCSAAANVLRLTKANALMHTNIHHNKWNVCFLSFTSSHIFWTLWNRPAYNRINKLESICHEIVVWLLGWMWCIIIICICAVCSLKSVWPPLIHSTDEINHRLAQLLIDFSFRLKVHCRFVVSYDFDFAAIYVVYVH